MLKLSAKSEYALRVIDFLRRTPGASDIHAISLGTWVPESLLRKIIGSLAGADIVMSHRGRTGGVSIWDAPRTLYEILIAMGEDISLVQCSHGECTELSRCGISTPLRRIQKGMEAFLKVTRI